MATSVAQRQVGSLSSSRRSVAVGSSRSGVSAPVMPARAAGSKAMRVSSIRSRIGLKVNAVIEAPSMKYESNSRASSSSVLSIILGGGAGSRLYPLTKTRAKPAVPIGGIYRLIDVPMSNCINSGLNKVYILTQYNSTSLNRHLSRAYNMGGGVRFGGDGFVEVLAATQTPTVTEWFQGTADAVRQYAWLLSDTKNRSIEDVVILSGDHLYRMDYMKFVNYHRESNADITLGCIPYDDSKAQEFGLMSIDQNRRITSFSEKPKTKEALDKMRVDTTVLGLSPEEAKEKPFIASMGIYVFKKDVLIKLLTETYPHAMDFGGEIIPAAAENLNVVAYPFYGYWEDIGTIKSFFEENLKLARSPSNFEFYDPQSPIYTSPRVLPPAHVEDSKVVDAIIAQGAYVKRSTISNAIIGLRAQIGEGCTIQDAMIMGADYYESDAQRAAAIAAGMVPIGIGANCFITNAIVDKNARIGNNVQIMNKEGISEATRDDVGIVIRSGIVVVTKGTFIREGTII